MSLWWVKKKKRERQTVDVQELELDHHCLSSHPSLLSLSLPNYVSWEHLPLTLGPSKSLLYPLVGNQARARKQSHKHTDACTCTCTHTHINTPQRLHHGAARSFYHSSFVFQVVISSHCCSSANQKSPKPMRVIILPSGKKKKKEKTGKLREDEERCVCVYVSVCVGVCYAIYYDPQPESTALSNKMARLDLFQSFACRRA